MSIVDNAVYVAGARQAVPLSLELTFETMAQTGGMGWIGLYRPSHDEVQRVADEFSLHPLVVEDTVAAHQRPKIEKYDDVWVTVLHPAVYQDDTERVEFGEVHVLSGPNFVVTSRYAESPNLADVRHRLESDPAMLAGGPSAVLYAILDQVVDEYGPVVAGLANDIDEIEIQVFSGDAGVSKRIYQLLREVIEFQRATHPLVEMIDTLVAGLGISQTAEELVRQLRDVQDHSIKVVDKVNGYRSLLESILTVNATLVGQRQSEETQRLTEAQFAQSEEVKKISSWAAILFAPTLVASVYGMNFDRIPELHWRLGYPMALVMMLSGSVALYAVFRRRNWL